MLAVVVSASTVANKIKEEATIVASQAEKLVKEIGKDQKSAEKKLLSAKPALEAAEAALQVNNFFICLSVGNLNQILDH